MKFLHFILILTAMVSLMISCGDNQDKIPTYNIERISDPLALPYRFQVLVRIDFISSETKEPTSGKIVPLDIYGDGKGGMYEICQSWRVSDSLSSLIFYSEIGKYNALRHVNINTPKIDSDFSYDFDRDGVQEVAITYVVRDTAFVEILDLDGDYLSRFPFAIGLDRDSNGYWDGGTYLIMVRDFNGDGIVEMLLHCDTGYDLYPRKIVCFDWSNDKVLWSYEIATTIFHDRIWIGPESVDGDTVIIIGMVSKGNAAVTSDMDDKRSQMVALDTRGNLKWKTETGGTFSNPHPVFIDYDGDGQLELLTAAEYFVQIDEADNPEAPIFGKLQVLSLKGTFIDSLILDSGKSIRSMQLFDLDGDGIDEILVTTQDLDVTIFNQQLTVTARYHTYASMNFWDCQDFLGNGQRQIIATSRDNRTLLLNNKFEPLAQLDDAIFIIDTYFQTHPDGDSTLELVVAINNSHSSLRLAIVKNPWNLIFFRKPWLAFLAALLPMMLIVAFVAFYSYRMRSKNRIISVARDKLNTALGELEMAQDKLVAAEKFRQAKDIAGGFAHEIRNALFPARASLSRLKRAHNDADNNLSQHAVRADKSVSRAIDLTSLISTYARLDSDRMPERVNIAEIVTEVITSNQIGIDELGVKITIQGDTELTVESNSKQFYSVINNLLLNSLDALTSRTEPTIIITWQKSINSVGLQFSDNGCGITQESAIRVFDTFFSTKPEKGTGMGLSIVKKTVEMYGGSISVSGDRDGGATFNLTLMPYKNDT